jgi:hypothetical protein
MAAIITATRTSSLTLFPGGVDQDGDGVMDPGDIIVTRVRITNSGDAAAGNITVEDTLSGLTLDGTSIKITPIAHDDGGAPFFITGNTPITFTAAQLLANDVDPDGAGGNAGLVISSVSAGSNGTIVDNLDGTYTFTPTTGLNVNQTASFQYTVTDAQGLQSVSTGIVTMTVNDVVWYVDNTYAGGGSDGSYLKPFTSLTPLNNNGADVDAAGESIFVFHNGGNYSDGIALEAGQKLLGDGQAFMANNHNIGGTSRTTGTDTVGTNSVIAMGTGTLVTLSTDNTVKGFTLDASGAAAVGMADGGTSVTSSAAGAKLLVSGVDFSGAGQAIDIDAGGHLDVTIGTLTSTGSAGAGVQLAGTAASGTGLLSGDFTVTNSLSNIGGSIGHAFQIGGNGPSSGGTIEVNYNGTIGGSTGGSAVNIADRLSTADAITLTGAISHTMSANTSAGIALSNIAGGTITLSGAKTITVNAGGQNAISVASQSDGTINLTGGAIDIDFATGTTGHAYSFASQTGGTVNVSTPAGSNDVDFAGTASGSGISVTSAGTPGGSVNFTGGGLTITTRSGDGIGVANTNQGTGQLNIGGSGNTITTDTGQIIDIVNSNTTGMTFGSLSSTGTVAGSGNAININNLDGGGTFSGGTVDINDTNIGDGINLSNSNTTFTFTSATIDNVGGDGIEVNGTASVQGAVTFGTVDIDGTGNHGILISNAANAVTISDGSIGTGGATLPADDPGADGVNINGGTGAVTIGADITKSSGGGFEAVDVSGHATGAILFSGDINASGGSGGIRLVNNSSGNITFSGANVQLNTGALAGLTYTNGAGTGGTNVSFTGGNFDITTTSGTGINATNGTAGNSTLAIGGAANSNSVAATTGRAVTLDGVSSAGVSFVSVAKNGGSETGIYLNNAGTGGFTVSGSLSNANSGGIIQNITGTNGQNTSGIGVYANNTDNISLSNMTFTGPLGNYAIKGNNVTNFTLRDSTISGAIGNDDVVENESAIYFVNLDGVGLFEGNNISGGYYDNMKIETNTGTLHLFVRDSASDQAVFGHNSNTVFANDSLGVEMSGNANLFAVVDGVQFTGWRGDGVGIQTIGTANSEITIKNSSFVNNHGNIASAGGIGVLIAGTGGGAGWNVDYVIEDNTFSGSKGYALAASFVGSAGKVRGFIEGNTIGTPGGGQQTTGSTTGSSEAGGMFLSLEKQLGSAGVLEHYVTVENNTIRDVAKYGIYVRSTNGGAAPANYVISEATIRNNTIDEMFGPGVAALRGLAGGNDAASGEAGRVGLDLQNNTFNADTSSDSYGAVFLDQIFGTNSLYYLPGYVGDMAGESYGVGNASLDINNYLAGRGNTMVPSTTANVAPWSTGVYASDAKLAATNLQAAPTRSDTQLPSGAMQMDPQLLVPVPVAPQAEETIGDGGQAGSEPGGAGGDILNPPAPTTPASASAGDDGVLSQAELAGLVDAAIQRWIDAGASAGQVAAMRAVDVGIVDMSGIYVGSARPGTISVDSDAGGFGWFVDSTPNEDSEFEGSGTKLTADLGGAAEGKVDLLTVLMHELGHQIGLADDYNANSDDDLMYGYAHVGERRLPAEGEAAGAVPGAVLNEAFAVIPATIASLPANKIVDVFFRSTINLQFDKAISPLMNTTTIKVGGVTVTTANENNALDSLTLGSTIYIDANKDGDFDAGEGVSAVALELYADTDDSGGWTAGDVLITTGSSGALGAYSFAGLAPGDYIVVVTAANFNSGQPLFGTQSSPGTADPDNNVDNDDNGIALVAGLGAAVASQTITLTYNGEPDGTPDIDGDADADTNLTLDFGFNTNAPPVAVDDPATVAEDSVDNIIDVKTNDTDPDAGDTLTVTAVTNPVNGTVSLDAGVVKFTPTANFSGAAGFDYTIDDGHGNTDTGHVNVTVTAVNDAPVNSVPVATQTFNEDGTLTFNAANSNLLTVSDIDAGSSDVQTTLAIQTGTLTINAAAVAALTSVTGDGTSTVVLTGTAAEINAALNGLVYNPGTNYNGDRILTVTTNDLGNTGTDPGATGTLTSEQDQDSITVDVTAVNDAPVVIGDGTEEADPIVEDTPGPGESGTSLFGGQYSDAVDAQFSAGNPGGSSSGAFAGIAVVANGSSAGTGQWQYFNTSTSLWVDIGTRSTASALLLDTSTLVRFSPALDFTGAAPTLTVHLIDNSLGFGIAFGQTADISGVGATGGSTAYSTGTVVLSQTVTVADLAPTLDLDADDSNSAGTGFASAYAEDGPPAAISDTDVLITDADAGDQVEGATITIANAVAGDVLSVVGALPGSITVHASTTATNLVLTGTGTQAEYAAAIEQITFANSGDNPTANGANTSRTINVTVTDGDLPSNVAVSTISVSGVNDNPTITNLQGNDVGYTEGSAPVFADAGGNALVIDDSPNFHEGTLTVEITGNEVAAEDVLFFAENADYKFDANLIVYQNSVQIASWSGGNPGDPWVFTFRAGAPPPPRSAGKAGGTEENINQTLPSTAQRVLTWTLTDGDGGSTSVTSTVTVTGANDSPVLTTGGPIAATEQTAVAILPAGAVSDVELDARNGGLGDYAGAQFSVNRNPATNPTEDDFSLVAGPNFTIEGSNLKAGGLIFGTINVDGSAGLIVITFTSLETFATSALVDEVIQSVRYTNNSDNPPASVDLAVGFEDGSPGGGQGAGATDLDVNLVTVTLAGVNDAPVNSLGGTIGTGEDFVDAWLSGMSISDPDADPATDEIVVTFAVANGTLDIDTSVVNGVASGDVTGDDSGTITVTATLNQINTTLAANNGLTYTSNLNFSGDDTLTVTTNDQGANGSGGSKSTISARTINVSPQPDAPVAQPDMVSTPEDTVGTTGNLLANDSDADGDTLSISGVTGGTVGTPFMLPSGAILQVNANGTYSYNPNGKFNTLTNPSGGEVGAVNTSATDTFEYTVSGGNTVTVTVTITGVANQFDWLEGDSGPNTISGTPNGDFFFVVQGGDDDLTGLGGNDVFFFGGAMTADDDVDGNAGIDQIALQGDYSAGLTFGADVLDVENLAILPGNDTRFGDSANNLYDYNITLLDVNVAPGVQMVVDANRLRADEDFTFNGSAETDGSFFIYGGGGTDKLTGGSNNDVFLFGAQGQWGSDDVLTGGGGIDQLALSGDYTVTFGANQLVGIEQIALVSAFDTRFGVLGETYDYNLTMNDGNVAGVQMTIDGALLRPTETLTFNGSAEDDGSFRVFGGQGVDVIVGSQQADILVGNLGADTLTGGGGADRFVYRSKDDSPAGGDRDAIQDFSSLDILDLTKVDAIDGGADDVFTFIGTANFGNVAGQLRAVVSSGPIWLVQGDTDGDGDADLEFFVTITDNGAINVGDFML